MEEVDLTYKVLAAFVAIFMAGFVIYSKFRKYVLDPLEKATELIKVMDENAKKEKAEKDAIATLQDTESPIVKIIHEIHNWVYDIRLVQEAKFELDNQAYFKCNSSGHLIEANDAFCKLTGVNKDDTILHQWVGIISDSFQDKFLEKWRMLVNYGLPINEVVPAKKGGKYLITAIRKPSNHPTAKFIMGTVGVVVGH